MVKEFEYKGFATDWIGFTFTYEGKDLTVIEDAGFRQYRVSYPGGTLSNASQFDLMNEYIYHLQAQIAVFEERELERGEYD